MKGLSGSNVFYLRSFSGAWPALERIVQQAAGLSLWGYIMVILGKLNARVTGMQRRLPSALLPTDRSYLDLR